MQRSALALAFSLFLACFAHLLAPAASAQQVQWKLNPLTNKYVGLTFGTSGWNAAQAQAVAYGGNLVTIRSAAENQWLINNFAAVWTQSGNGPWHGFRDVAIEGQWRWVSGEPVTYGNPPGIPWAPGEPSNGFGIEDWGHFLASGSWNDAQEFVPYRALIEVNQLPPRSWSWPSNFTGGGQPLYGYIFDMDGDGDLDYASPEGSTGQVWVWRNVGQGSFVLATTISGMCFPTTTIANDWDGDGDQDLLVADQNCQAVQLLRNLGSGNSWSLQALVSGVGIAHGLTLGDVNKDGLEDLIVSSVGCSGIRIFLKQSGGNLAPPQVLGSILCDAYQPTLADLDNDGNLDLLLAGEGVLILRGSQSGTFTNLGSLTGSSRRCIANDLNGDGRLEVLVPRLSGGTLEIWSSNGSATLSLSNYSLTQSLPVGSSPYWIESGDLDGDSDLDVVVPSFSPNLVRILRNQSGSLSEDHLLQLPGSPLSVQVGDLNGDTKPDIISSNDSSNSFSVHLNQSIFDCNANGIDDPLDLASGVALDCNGNGRPDSCDIAFGISQDSDGDGIPNECEPTLVGIQPAVRAAALAGTVAVQALNIPAGAATLSLSGPALAAPVAVPITLVAGAGNQVSAQVALSSLFTIEAKGFAGDVVLSGTISWTDGLGAQQTTGVTPGVFTFDVPEVVTVQPSSVPFDGPNSVLIELDDNVIQQGIGAVRFGAQPAVFGSWLQIAGKTYVSAIAPPQPAPGDYPIELEITAGGVKEITRVESRALIHLGPGIQSLSQISGFQGGGEPLTFALVGFQPGVPVQVAFGSVSVSASPVGFLAASTLTVLTPLSPVAGVVDLTLTQVLGPGQVKTAVSPAAFEFIPPGVGALSQTSGPQAGGQALSVTTDGFAAGSITVRLGTTVTQGSVQGSGANQTVSWTSVASPVAGPVDLTLVQGVFTVTKPAAYTFNAPQLLSVTPNQGSWYQPQTVQIQGQNFAPNLPVSVRFTGESPIAGVVQSSSSIQVNLPAGFLKGAGPLGLIVTQAGVNASLPAAFLCLPALTTSLTGSAAQGGQLRYQVQSQQSGFAIALLSAGLSPLPLTLPDIHAGFSLDFATSFNLGSGGLLVTPTLQVNFPPLSVPPGTTLQAQALALEFGPLGTWYSFTNTVPVLLP